MKLPFLAVLGASLLASGCALFIDARSRAESGNAAQDQGAYGNQAEVLSTIDAVKTTGAIRLMSSRAVRLPKRSFESITAFEYRYPEICGGHAFRVYGSGDTQILEYSYERADGMQFMIRDYVAGSSPFIQPGLWTSYDHTSGGIPSMT